MISTHSLAAACHRFRKRSIGCATFVFGWRCSACKGAQFQELWQSWHCASAASSLTVVIIVVDGSPLENAPLKLSSLNACDPTAAGCQSTVGRAAAWIEGIPVALFLLFSNSSQEIKVLFCSCQSQRSEIREKCQMVFAFLFFFAGGKERNAVPQLTDFEIPTSFWYELKSLTEILMDNVNREFCLRHVETRARADSYD